MKTLLAKALGMQGEYVEQLRKLQNFTEIKMHDHMAVVESIEFKLSALEQELDTVNKKLTVLIKLLRHVIGQDSKPSDMQKGDPTGDQQGNPPKPGQDNMSKTEPVPETFKQYLIL